MHAVRSQVLRDPVPTISQPGQVGGLIAWYDASLTSSITEAAGAVSQWNDQMVGARHVAQSVAGSKPTTNATTINGRNVIDFDGTADHLFNSSPWLRALETATYYSIEKNSGAPGATLAEGRSSNANPYFMPIRSDGHAGRGDAGAGTDWDLQSGISTSTDSTVHVKATRDTSAFVEQWVDVARGAGGSYTRTATTLDRYAIGALIRTTVSNFKVGSIGEIPIYDSVHTIREKVAVERYLARKWGVTVKSASGY